MAETSKPNYSAIWAFSGDKETLTSSIVNQGWVVGKPSFQRANAVENRQDQMLQHIDQHGIVMWSSDTEYFANKSYVTGSNGEIYRAVADSVGVNPVGDTSNKWYRVLDDFFTKTQADARYLGLAVPSGAVFHFAMATAPAGYLVCNGAAVSRTAFAALFAAIGTLYGSGDGSTTFNLPDLRGEFLRGADLGKGVDPSRVFGSAQKGTLVGGYDDNNIGTDVGFLASRGVRDYGSDPVDITTYGATETLINQGTRVSTGIVGGGAGFYAVTRPRNIALLACIKV